MEAHDFHEVVDKEKQIWEEDKYVTAQTPVSLYALHRSTWRWCVLAVMTSLVHSLIPTVERA